MVGTSGRSGLRCAELIPSGRSNPDFTGCNAVLSESNITWMLPDNRSVNAGPEHAPYLIGDDARDQQDQQRMPVADKIAHGRARHRWTPWAMVPAETPLTRISMPLFNIAASGNSASPSAADVSKPGSCRIAALPISP
jgi:hypothetical protein